MEASIRAAEEETSRAKAAGDDKERDIWLTKEQALRTKEQALRTKEHDLRTEKQQLRDEKARKEALQQGMGSC